MTKKIVSAIFPRVYFLGVALGVMLLFSESRYAVLGFSFLNLVLMLVLIKPAVLIHESGHLLMARLMGGKPRRMILGTGHQIIRFNCLGIKIILNSRFNSGLAIAIFEKPEPIRLKLAFFSLGGVLFNSIIVGVIYFTIGFEIGKRPEVSFSEAFFVANFMAALSALIPYTIKIHGVRFESDGLRLIRILFGKREKLKMESNLGEYLDAMDLVEEKKYQESVLAYQELITKYGELKIDAINLSAAYMKMGDFENALSVLEEMIPRLDDETRKRYSGFINNALAWNCLLLGRLEEADRYSEDAFKEMGKNEFVKGTRGCVLVELEKWKEGIDLLLPNVNLKFVNSLTLSDSMYLALAFYKLGDLKKSSDYLKFVEANLEDLEKDEKVLFSRVKTKMAETN